MAKHKEIERMIFHRLTYRVVQPVTNGPTLTHSEETVNISAVVDRGGGTPLVQCNTCPGRNTISVTPLTETDRLV